MKPIIRVENLNKQYRLGARQAPYGTLRDTLASVVREPLKRLRGNGQSTNEILWALRDVTFDVYPGEVVGIIGRNGAGKSTLLKILSRITEPTTGRVELYGRIASLLEVGTGFHPELTGRENIFLNGAILGMRKAEIDRRFDEIVAFAEIDRFIDTPVKHYSSGMYVRLAFAVAAHLEPEILIVDEVLAVGDAAFQKKCLGKMSDVARHGRTVLFVSHNMVAVRALCGRAIMLHEGRLTKDGLANEVVSQYLGSGQVSKAEIIWSDSMRAPGNEVFRLHGVRLRNAHGAVTSEVSSDESFCIEIDYRNLSAGSGLGATVILYNEDGVCVFSSPSNREPNWHGRRFPEGLFCSSCRIPANFLAEGRFNVSVLVWANNYSCAHREDRVVEFEVHDLGETRKDYFGKWDGVVRPSLQWHTEHLETGPLGHDSERD
jgi:lipopolysaccharide transport system ATP-binding protein